MLMGGRHSILLAQIVVSHLMVFGFILTSTSCVPLTCLTFTRSSDCMHQHLHHCESGAYTGKVYGLELVFIMDLKNSSLFKFDKNRELRGELLSLPATFVEDTGVYQVYPPTTIPEDARELE